MTSPTPHVGTMRETPLHASLKRWCAADGDSFEVPVDGFVIDIVRGEQLIEIQTSGFSGLKQKLTRLLDAGHRVKVVHPIAAMKWIVKVDDAGDELSRRRSPKRGEAADVVGELVSIPHLLDEPGLEIEVLLTHEEEIRYHDPGRAWRRRGWVVLERRLLGVVDAVALAGPDDLLRLVPDALPEPFTTADLAAALGRPRRIAQQMAYCLRRCGAATPDGKDGNAILYRLTGTR